MSSWTNWSGHVHLTDPAEANPSRRNGDGNIFSDDYITAILTSFGVHLTSNHAEFEWENNSPTKQKYSER